MDQLHKENISIAMLNKLKEKDKDRYYCAPKIYGPINMKIAITMRDKFSVMVEFDEETPWGKTLTTRQIAELNGNKQSGVVRQRIEKYGYVNIQHTRYYCHIRPSSVISNGNVQPSNSIDNSIGSHCR